MAILKNKKTESKAKVVKDAPASMKELYSEKTVKAAGVKHQIKVSAASQSYRVLVRPIITEKSTHQNVLNKYAFEVSRDANKIQIATAISELYGVKPVKVNLANLEGKYKVRGRIQGKRKDWRKAVVTLPKGKTIDVYEGV